MVRAPRYGYQQGYASWMRQPTWWGGERVDERNPFYRQDLTGADEEISLEDVEKPPTFVPLIDRQPLGYKDVLGSRQHPWQAGGPTPPTFVDERARERGFGDLFGGPERPPGLGERLQKAFRGGGEQTPYGNRPAIILRQSLEDYNAGKPVSASELQRAGVISLEDYNAGKPTQDTQSYWTGSAAVVPPTPPQQDTQSVADIFSPRQSGAIAMAEDPRGERSRRRHEAARIAREAFARDPSLIKEFMPKLQAAGVDPALGAPEGWSPPDTGTLTADDMAAPFMSSRPVGTTRSIVGQAPAETDPWAAADADWRDFERRRDINMVRPEGPPGGPPGQQSPAPYASLIAGRPAGPGPVTGLSQMTPNIPAARPSGGMPFTGNLPRPRPQGLLPEEMAIDERIGQPFQTLGPDQPVGLREAFGLPREDPRLPRARPEGIPAQVANLRNGPRDITRGLIAGGQEARLPLPRPDYTAPAFAGNLPRPRPDMPQDVAARPPLIDPGRFGAVPPSPAASPLSVRRGLRIPDDASMPPGLAPPIRTGFGNEALGLDPATGMPAGQGMVQQAVPPPIDPAAIAEARQTLQLHPDTGRIRTAPGLQQFNEPARTPPVVGQAETPLIRPDLTQAAANYTPARLPRPRPEEFGPPIDAMEAIGSDVPGPQSGLVRDSVSGKLYDPTASGGPANPETPEEELARKTLIGRLRGEDLIAAPEVGAINEGQPLPPPPSPTLPPITEQQTIDDRPALIASPATTPTNPRLSPREIEKRARERGFGTVENLTGDRWARAGGAAAGVAAGLATGNPLAAVGLGVQGYRSGDDVRRSYMNRTGPFGILGNIFGMGRRDKDKDKDKDKRPESLARKDPTSLPSSVYGSLGPRYQGGTYTGQSTGGRHIGEGTGGAFR